MGVVIEPSQRISVLKQTFAMEVGDDGMKPLIIKDDLATVDRTLSPGEGEILAARVDGEEPIVRHYRSEDGMLTLIPLDPSFPTLDSREHEIVVLGVVVCAERQVYSINDQYDVV